MTLRASTVLALYFAAVLLVPPVVLHAAITAAVLTANDTSNAGSEMVIDTDAISPQADRLLIACVTNAKASAPDVITSLASDGLTWVPMETQVNSADTIRISSFRAMGAAPGSDTITMTFPDIPTHVQWQVLEFAGVDTSGTHGSGAIVQATKNSGAATTTLTVTLAAFGDATNNAGQACFGSGANTTFTAETGNGWAEISTEQNVTSPTGTLGEMFKVGEDTSALGTFGSSAGVIGIAHEIKMAGGGGGGGGLRSLMMGGVGGRR
jgi:hypothetical protein